MLTGDLTKIMNILLLAMNDWPGCVSNLEEYSEEVKKFVNGPVTRDSIHQTLKEKLILKHAWEAESLFQLSEIFQYYDCTVSLEEIVADLKSKLSKLACD